MKLYFLSGGMLDAARSVIHPGDDSRHRVTLPVMQVLIESDGKRLLVDTGLPSTVAGDTDALRREYGIEPDWIRAQIGAEERVDRQLARVGLTPSEVDLVVNTHFHFDHAGGNALFAGVPFWVQEAEIMAAREDGYLPVWDAPHLQFFTVVGDWSPLPGVQMLHTPGHTPGHQSMLVRLEHETWLFTWDAVYTEEHWRQDKVGAVVDAAAARASIERLRQIAAAEKARLIFGHDPAQWDSLKHAPDYYE